jgi:hypothetical protein
MVERILLLSCVVEMESETNQVRRLFGPAFKELRGMLADQLVFWAIAIDIDSERALKLLEVVRWQVEAHRGSKSQ